VLPQGAVSTAAGACAEEDHPVAPLTTTRQSPFLAFVYLRSIDYLEEKVI